MSEKVVDRSADAINTTGSFDSVAEDGDNDILLSSLNEDPDLEWILDAASMDNSSCCDHSDHEHVEQSSSSESLDEIGIISEVEGGDIEAIPAGGKSSGSKAKGATNPILSAKTIAFASSAATSPVKSPSPRLPRKINGDDTILNLYAATVAKAMAPSQRAKKDNSEDTKRGMEPIITSPHQKPKNTVGMALTPPRTTKISVPLVSSPSQDPSKEVMTTSSTPTSVKISPVNRIAPDVTAPVKRKSLDDPLLKLFATTVQKASTKVAAVKRDGALDSALIQSEVTSSSKGKYQSRKTPTINPSPAMAQRQPKNEKKQPYLKQEQQYLQLEIAKELDASSNSRRFQLAIQSHISQLTMGSSLGDEDDAYEAIVMTADSNKRNRRNEEDAEASIEEIEMSLDEVTEQIVQLEAKQAESQSQQPLPALQYDHAWMRNKLWGSTAQKADNSSVKVHSPKTQLSSDGTSKLMPRLVTDNEAENPNTDKNVGYEGFLEAWNVSTVSRSSKYLTAWRDPVLHICIVYVVPCACRMASDLPQLYFLIELFHTYHRKVQFGGLILAMSFGCRLSVRALSFRRPRLCAIVGTIVTLLGFIVKILTGSVKSLKENAGTELLPSVLFVLGTILVGFNEMSVFLQFSLLEWTRASASRKVDPETALLRCYRQWRITQVSSVVAFALGGLVYDVFDFIGIAIAAFLLTFVQLVGVLLICSLRQRDPDLPCEMTFSQLLWSDAECSKNLSQILSLDSNKATIDHGGSEINRGNEDSNEFKLQDRSGSFRSILTSELETILETPNIESDVEDDSGRRRSRRRSSVSRHGGESVASGSSGTPPYDNRTITRAYRARHDPEQGDTPLTPSMPTQVDSDSFSAIWMDYIASLFIALHPLLNCLVFAPTTLYLFVRLDQAKYAIGFIYASCWLCNLLPSFLLSFGIVDGRLLKRFHWFMTLSLFACTYMILLTAIPELSSFVIGVLGMSFLLGSFVQSLNEYQRHRMQLSETFRALAPYRPWLRNMAQMLALLLAPVFLVIFPRLPYMVASGCCCVFTALVYLAVEREPTKKEETAADDDVGGPETPPLSPPAFDEEQR